MNITEPLWTSVELAQVCNSQAKEAWFADGVQVDSRDITPGDLFVALEGQVSDGHTYVLEAFKRGAVAAVVSRTPDGMMADDPRLVCVQDTQAALKLMAASARTRAPAQVIAVTGSAGKTSVVQALRQCLTPTAATHSSIRSFNNHVGIPLSLARMPRCSRYGIFEVGMNTAGEIRRGGHMVQPNIAVITTVGAAHAGNFATEAAIADEKISLVDELQPGGVALLGIDHVYGGYIADYARARGVETLTVSAMPEADADIKPLRLSARHDCTCLTATIAGTVVTYKIAQPGREWVLNSLLVLGAAKAAGADLGQAAMSLACLEAEAGRGRVHRLHINQEEITLLDDSYNANPLSMRAALGRLALCPVTGGGRRIAVLADMQELGSVSAAAHQSLVPELRAAGISKIVAFGDQVAAAGKAAGIKTEVWQMNNETALRLFHSFRPGDAIMVKGANSAHLGQLVAGMVEAGHSSQYAAQAAHAGGW